MSFKQMDRNPLDRIPSDDAPTEPVARRITAGSPGFGAEKTNFKATLEAPVSYGFDHTITINTATLEQMVSDVVSKQTGHAVTQVLFNITRDFCVSNVQVTLGAKL
jgi:hypothetical protein